MRSRYTEAESFWNARKKVTTWKLKKNVQKLNLKHELNLKINLEIKMKQNCYKTNLGINPKNKNKTEEKINPKIKLKKPEIKTNLKQKINLVVHPFCFVGSFWTCFFPFKYVTWWTSIRCFYSTTLFYWLQIWFNQKSLWYFSWKS